MKTLSLIVFLLGFDYAAHAQDSIRIINGRVITGKVKSVRPYEIAFYGQNKHAAPNSYNAYRRLSASEITEIVYADGRRDSVLPLLHTWHDSANRHFDKEFYALGENDAKLYYHKYTGASAGTLLATFPGSPLLGLIVAVSTSATKPSPRRFTYPNPAFLQSEAYKSGYAHKAHQIKAGKAWASWGMGTLATVAFFLLLSGASK